MGMQRRIVLGPWWETGIGRFYLVLHKVKAWTDRPLGRIPNACPQKALGSGIVFLMLGL